MTPTADPAVFIEYSEEGLIRYQDLNGKRWEVAGICDKRGDCLVGAVIDGETVQTIERARELALGYAGLDCPVSMGFSGCCPLVVTELPDAQK